MATATERILARRVIAGDYTVAEVGERYQDGVLDAIATFAVQGVVTDERLAEILSQAAADGLIEVPDDIEVDTSEE